MINTLIKTYQSTIINTVQNGSLSNPLNPYILIGSQKWAKKNSSITKTLMNNEIALITVDATWITSQTLYDNAYAAKSGTTTEKIYAGVKAAAMYRNYGNNPDNSVVYGVLYNWFAIKLIQMDIDLYNTANPTTPYTAHCPSDTEYLTLRTYLGGDTIAGGKMKEIGLTHWNEPNTGADNASKFTAIPSGGIRLDTGIFEGLGIYTGLWTITEGGVGAYRFLLTSTSSSLPNALGVNKKAGLSLRLIHDVVFPIPLI